MKFSKLDYNKWYSFGAINQKNECRVVNCKLLAAVKDNRITTAVFLSDNYYTHEWVKGVDYVFLGNYPKYFMNQFKLVMVRGPGKFNYTELPDIKH